MNSNFLRLQLVVIGLAVLSLSAPVWGIECVTPEELKSLMDSGAPGFLVVDVQPNAAYSMGHILGAVNFPWTMELKSPGTLPRDKTLILYCDCGGVAAAGGFGFGITESAAMCDSKDDSADMAEQLVAKFGYRDIRVLAGGWSKWKQLGFPVAQSPPP
jgi:rhodanese-related sulfurtransferase